jgi:hypothetical protein
MTQNYHTLSTLTALAIENDVDFEVWHGVTTAVDQRTRAHMIISPAYAPAVQVTFGDKKHDQRVSRLVLASGDLQVKLADLIRTMSENTVRNRWKHDLPTEDFSYQKKFEGKDDTIAIDGQVVEYLGKEGIVHSYKVLMRNFIQTASGTIEEASPSAFLYQDTIVVLPLKKLRGQGKYQYPNVITEFQGTITDD